MIAVKNQNININKKPLIVSDCLRLLNCFLFHSTQNIAVCLVAYIQFIDTAPVCTVGSVTIGGASCVKVWREFRSKFVYHVD